MRRVAILFLLCLTSCGSSIEADRSSFEASVDSFCVTAVDVCEYDPLVEDPLYADLAACHSIWDDSFYDQDEACAAASAAYLACFAALDCDGVKSLAMSTPDGVCMAEEEAWSDCYPF